MKKLLLLFMVLMFSFSVFGAMWGKDESGANTDIIVIEGETDGEFVILPKDHLTTILNLENKMLIFQYGSANKAIRIMRFKQRSSALRILNQLYPEKFCLSLSGIRKCTWVDVLGGKDKIEAESQ